MIRLLAAALAFVCTSTSAAYRVYQLKLTHYNDKGKVVRVQHILSSLDPRGYEGYYGAYRWDRVELEDTWYCPGDTSRHNACPKPKASRQPASGGGLPLNRQPVIP